MTLWRSSAIVLIACISAAVTSPAVAGMSRWTRSGPDGGDVRSIAVDARSENVIYAVVNGTIFKSEDEGGHWRTANTGVTAWIATIAISPADPAVLYAAGFAGEAELFKSTDAGQHWVAIRAPNQLHGLARLAISGDALLVASESAVDRSTDDGRSWQRTFTTVVDGTAYCCISKLFTHPDGSLFLIHRTTYRSTDRGLTWKALPASPRDAVTGAIDSDGTIYVVTAESFTRVMHRSRDKGASWSVVFRLEGPVRSIDAVPGRLYVSRGCNPDELAFAEFCRNSLAEYDGTTLSEQAGFAGTAVTQVVSSGAKLFAATDGRGVLTKTGTIRDWIPVNRGLPGPPAYGIAVSPNHPAAVYANTRAGLLKSDDYGTTWRTIGDAGWQSISVSPADRDVAYIATAGGLKKTTDGGVSFTIVQPTAAAAVTVAPSNADTIYAALFEGMKKSSDAGGSWTASNTGITIFNRDSLGFFANTVVVDPHDETTAYLGRDEALYKTTSGGARWAPLLTSRPFGDGFADFWGSTVVVDPFDSRTLFVVRDHKSVMTSRDAGTTWADAGFPLTARALFFDAATANVLYAITTNRAVFRSDDRGATFSPFGDGLDGVLVYDLTIDASGHFLYAATSHGIYSLQIDTNPRKRRRSAGR